VEERARARWATVVRWGGTGARAMGHGRALGRQGRARDGALARARWPTGSRWATVARAGEARARAMGATGALAGVAWPRARWATGARAGGNRRARGGGTGARAMGLWRARGGPPALARGWHGRGRDGALARARWGSGARAVVTRARARGWHRGARARRYHPQKASYAWYFDAIFCRHAQKNVKIASAKFQNFLTSFFIYLIFQR